MRTTHAHSGSIPPTTHTALTRLQRELWPPRFLELYPDDVVAAEGDCALALLGHAHGYNDYRLMATECGALPLLWSCLWRPLSQGGTGIDVALGWHRLDAPVLQAGLRRLAEARGVYAECVNVEPHQGELVLRDLFDGTIYRVSNVRATILEQAAPSRRCFGVLAEVGDGTFSHVGALTFGAALDRLTPAEFVACARAALERAGRDPDDIDPERPHRGLVRWAGIALSATRRRLDEASRH